MHYNTLANKIGALSFALLDEADSSNTRSQSTISTLLTLFHWGDMPITHVAKIIGLSQSATTRLIETLRVEGLVRQGQTKGRLRPASLTAAGRRLAERLQSKRQSHLEFAIKSLSNTECEQLDIILSQVLAEFVEDRPSAKRLCRQCDHRICSGSDCPVGMRASELENSE